MGKSPMTEFCFLFIFVRQKNHSYLTDQFSFYQADHTLLNIILNFSAIM